MEFMLGGGGLEFGDPLMMMLPPVEQYSNDYHLKLVSDFTNYSLKVCNTTVPPASKHLLW